ncbi:MAG: FAD-binding oxidoreductase [Synergistaceae bacterium]|nr:FAD-binding oxidoreductase [Synergistaceae bacterium]
MKEHLEKFFEDLRKNCPRTDILRDAEDRLAYSRGCYPREYKWMLKGEYPYMTGGVLLPGDADDVSRIMRLARKHGVGVIPYGGGSGIVGGTIPYNGEVVADTGRLNDFSLNAVNMRARGGAGLSGAEFENMLNARGFSSGHYPQSFQSASLGGMVSTRAVGTFSTKYGKMDDMVTALDVVLPDGELLRTHGAPKRSSGPELMQLFLGGEGVYGIVTSVEMKIYPIPEKRIFCAYTFPSTEDGLSALRAIVHRGIRPAVVRLYDEAEAEHKIALYCFEKGHALLVLIFEGYEDTTELEAKAADAICEAHLGRGKGGRAAEEWHATRFSTKKMLDYDATRGGTADAIEVAATWDRITDLWKGMRDALLPLCESVDCHFSHIYHSGASVYVIFHARTGGDDSDGEARYLECLRVACETSVKYGGNVSHHHGIGTAKGAFLRLEHGDSGVSVIKRIKDALDPDGILNRGVLGL